MPFWSVDDKAARTLLIDIQKRATDYTRLYKQAVIPEVKNQIAGNLKGQHTPKGIKFPDSKLSIKEGRPGFTLLRKWKLFQDMQSDSNYAISGNKLNVSTSVRDKKGFLYGAKLNAYRNKQWQFAGVTTEGARTIVRNIIGIVLYNRTSNQ